MGSQSAATIAAVSSFTELLLHVRTQKTPSTLCLFIMHFAPKIRHKFCAANRQTESC